VDTLQLIKRLAIRRRVRFTEKARVEMETDSLTADDVLEALVNARRIDKTIRSRSPSRSHRHEKLYVIKSVNFEGTLIYTKGTIRQRGEEQVFYVLVSAKTSRLH
jgi:hypothetical protein